MRPLICAPRLKKIIITAFTAMSLAGVIASAELFASEFQPQFKNTDINEFVTSVGKSLKKTMVVDPNVRGKVNFRSYDVLSDQQYYQVFLNVLDVYGFAAVEMDNNVIKIVRNKDAKTSSIPVISGEEGDEGFVGDMMVTRVIEVKNVTVRELVPLLRQLVDSGGGGNVTNYDPANVIMVTGTAATVSRIVKIIERVDRAGDQDVQIIKLNYASASEMVRIVESMNKPTAGSKSSNTPAFLIPKIVADDRTNSVIVSGEPKARERVAKLVERLDSELETSGNTRVYYLKYSKAEELVPVLKGVSESIKAEENSSSTKTTSRTSANNSARNISIDAHKDTNTLVITAEPDMLRSLEAVIRQLDIRRAQVLVEAIIVEIYQADGVNLGIQWFSPQLGATQFTNGPAPLGQVAVGIEAAKDTPGEKGSTVVSENGTTTINEDANDIKGDYSILANALSGASGLITGIVKSDIGVILQAVSTDTNSNILATPSITTLDNEEAYFIVGQDVPIITGSTASSTNSNPFQQIERQEVGIKLKVTPQVNEGSGVQLTIEQEVSSVSGATGVDIAINKREIKTTVMADDGGTVVLGGLIDEDVQESEQKVPLLGDIPVLGHLFKSTSTTVRKRNLMVFLKATIIRDADGMNEITKTKYNYIRADELIKRDNGLSLLDDEHLPLLPKWNDDLTLPPSFDEFMDKKDEVEANKNSNENKE